MPKESWRPAAAACKRAAVSKLLLSVMFLKKRHPLFSKVRLHLLACCALAYLCSGNLTEIRAKGFDQSAAKPTDSVQMERKVALAGPLDITEERFQNPPNEYRIVQYQLTPSTLQKYPQYGIGATMAFFYSMLYPESRRENYRLGGRGPDIIGELIDAAEAIDYRVWLADDWGYPSGMAGGRVVAENPDFEVKSLTMLTLNGRGREVIDYSLPEDLHDISHAILYPLRRGEIDLQAGKRLETEAKHIRAQGMAGHWELRIFARYVRAKDVQAQSTMAQFGHTGRYPDLMNPKAIARFIANMHEPILEQISDPATQVEGFYTNEPNLMQTHWTSAYAAPYASVPWSDGLAGQFEKMHGYEIASILPALFEGADDQARRARIHYRQAVAELLTDSFARQIREWCNARGVKSSGHFLLNEYLSMHVQGYGDLMKFVSEFDVPALDIPIPNPDEFQDFAYEQSRFFSSVASWKKRDSTILLLDPIIGGYGLSRLSPALPLLINAINMASFHGVDQFSSYLPLDARKQTDAKGRLTEAAGYTKAEYNFLNEYTGRLNQVLRGARREAGVGLYYPIAMFQGDLLASDKFWPQIVNEHRPRQQAWDLTQRALLDGDVEFMIVHPEAVAEASIIDGHLSIGFGSYHTLVMPQLDFIPLAVVEKLQAFERQGGTVLWVGELPRGAETADNDPQILAALSSASAISTDALAGTIARAYSQDFDLRFKPGTDQLLIGRFHQKGEQVYLLINRSQSALSVDISGYRSAGDLPMGRLLDPSTGEIRQISVPTSLNLAANRSLLLIPDRQYLEKDLRQF